MKLNVKSSEGNIFLFSETKFLRKKKKKICTQILTLALSFPNKRTSPLNTCKVM